MEALKGYFSHKRYIIAGLVDEVYTEIHTESLKRQTVIFNNNND